ncbi:hypothetical protein OIU84_006979 [Salix udensis]|uniref:Auxin efflux carrier family protein n=1 Tax=Salix udensis TaxID=889485 RepID=A0AAD6P2T9_9ROSI|nr:hypothetical protein OIU84_006979 [Salix udensis]
MGPLDLLIASSIPVLKVLLITAIGSYLALDHVDVLGEDARKHVNNVGHAIQYSHHICHWFHTWLDCCPIHQTSLTPAWPHRGLLCSRKRKPFGSPDICETLGLGYVSLSMAIGAVYLWSYVFNIVRASSVPSDKQLDRIHVDESSIETPNSELGSCKEPLLASEKDGMVVRSGLKQKIMVVFGNINWKSLFAPSTIGAIVGLIIGVIPLTRKLMVGNDAPLRVIQDSASLLGLARVRGSEICDFWHHSCSLYCLAPNWHFHLPPAMNMGAITQLFGAGETECSVIILWAYALASISLTLWSTFFMWLVA